MNQWLILRFLVHLVAYVLTPGLINITLATTPLQNAQEAGLRHTALQNEQEVRPLEVGKRIVREMKGSETHAYRLTLTAGQLLHAVVDQHGIDVVVSLFGPDGKQAVEVDSPNGIQGPEPVWAIADVSGAYRLEVRSLDKDAMPGRYEVRIEELRAASQQDRNRVAGERAFMDAEGLRRQGDEASLQKAIAKYEEALQARRVARDQSGEATALSNIGYIYDSLAEKQKALDYFNQALPILRAIGDRQDEAITLSYIGYIYNSIGEKPKALDYYNQALPLYRAIGDRAGEAKSLSYTGYIYNSIGELQKALDYYNQALPISRAIGDRSVEANTLDQIGYIYNLIGEKQKALEHFNLALPIFRAIGDRSSEATMLNNIGAVYSSLGEKQKAFDYHHQALLLSRAAGDRSVEAKSLSRIGLVYESLSELQKALAYFNQALPLSRAAGDRSSEATTLSNIGAVYNSLGEAQKALEYYHQALPIYRAIGSRSGEATTLNNIGTVYDSLGEVQKALEHFNRALMVYREVGDRSGEAASLNNIGAVYNSLGELRKALDHYNQVLPIVRELGDRADEVASLNNIGHIYSSLGEVPKALEHFNQALPIARAIGNRSGEASTLNNIGAAYDSLGEVQKALDYYNQTLPIYQAIGDRPSKAISLNNIGVAYQSLGEKEKALEYFNQALLLRRAVGDRFGEAITLTNIGYTNESLDRTQKALDSYLQAIANIESLRASASIEEIKAGLSEESAYTYQQAVPLLMQLRRPAQAFDLTERARARTFLDQMGNVRLNQPKISNAQLTQEEQTLASELTSLEQRLRQERSKPAPSLNKDAISSIENQLAGKQRRYEDLLLRIKLTNPEYASLRSIDTLTLSAIQQTLNKDTTLLSYFVTPEKTLAFIITRDAFRAVETPVKEADLKAAIRWFRNFANLRNPRPESLKQFYSWLIAPVKQYLQTPIVGVIPHGILHYLPFAALTDGRHFFGNEHTIFYLPSASVLPFIKNKSKPLGNQVFAVAQSQAEGLPILQYADEEAKTVADLYNTRALTTGGALKSEFLKRAGDYSILHLAAHAELNTASPLFSRIMLRRGKDDNGTLEVREVFDMDLSKASLVVLSACETQLGAQSKGDDIVGLNRAFIYAGTPTVIASLWTVDDESTSYLMKAFYTHLKRGMSKAKALREAQSDTRKKYPHPYYWAAFVLTGDPG